MHFTHVGAFLASLVTVSAQFKGFNYGSLNTDGSPITGDQYSNDFKTAQGLVGASGFSSARLFTSIQGGTTNAFTQAIPAAISTKTSLVLGLWASAGQTGIENELAALRSALSTYGETFAKLIVGISVGSEDLYRISPIGIENESGIGAGPEEVAGYIDEVRNALKSTAAKGIPVGHVDTWTAWVNGSNAAVIQAADFIGTDAYPYFQDTMENSIENGASLFQSAYDQTVNAAGGKPVWVTETGWPVSGKTRNLAVADLTNAKTYWDQVGCGKLFGKVNTWWYTLQDAFPSTPNPSFGIVGSTLSTKPLFDLSCSDTSSKPASSKGASPVSSGTAATEQAGSPGAEGEASAKGSGPSPTASSGGGAPAPAPPPASRTPGVPAGGSKPGKVEIVYTTLTTCPATTVTGGETKTYLATSAVVVTSHPVGSPESAIPNTLVTQTVAQPSGSACPTSLSGPYEYPHLIVPVDKENPTKPGGDSFNGTISPTISSIFNFDIPASYAGKTCSLIFLLPTQGKLETSAYSLSGSGGIDAARLTSPATEQTSYDTVASVAKEFGGPASVTPGNSYVIGTGPCNANQRLGYKISATGTLSLNYFQDYNPSPIGLYVTVC